MIGLCFSMQGEDFFDFTNGKCHVFTFSQVSCVLAQVHCIYLI